nr:putative reverse transcriptase domain-containing protein [Tanacetum cinerariifolium]
MSLRMRNLLLLSNQKYHRVGDMRHASALDFASRVSQTSAILVEVEVEIEHSLDDEPASPLRDVSQGEACPTDSGFIADQDRATIDKSSTLPHDSAPRVTSPTAVEGSMQQIILELTALCTSLQRQLSELTAKFQAQEVEINRLKERVKLLEDREGVAATRFGDDAPIKGRSMGEGEVATERISDDSEEMATVLTSIDAATLLASGVFDVPIGSGSIPTTSTPAEEQVPISSDVVPTASPVFSTATVVTPYKRRKGKEVMVESKTLKKQKVQEQIDAQVARELEEQLEREDQRRSEQIARDAEIARIHAEEELQIMIDGLDRNNETVAKYLQEYHQFASEFPIERRIELITDLVKYQDNYAKVKDFKGITFEEVEAKFNSVWKQLEDIVPIGSKEEAERFKRKGISFEQESAKKQKISEEVSEEVKSHDEVPEEKVKEMMQLVPIEEVEDLNQLWSLVKETLSNRPPISDKEMELWVELSILYEPDNEDQLWTHTQDFMHALVEWKLYDSCEVHHVTSKDKEIFMLVEKHYPLRKGLALVMTSYKVQVENYSQMANDLILKIYKIANSPRQQEVDPLNPSPLASESEPEDAIEVENPIKHKDETVPASIHEVGTLTLFLVGWLLFQDDCVVAKWSMHWSRRKEKQRTSIMMVEKLGNAKDKVECKKLKKELKEARIMPLKSTPLTQASIHQMIKENLDTAITAERARQANIRNDASGSGPVRGQDAAPTVCECMFAGFMKCNPTAFHGTEGAVELLRWFKKTKSVFGISECVEGKKVKFAATTFQGPALTWWNAKIATMGLETVNQIP